MSSSTRSANTSGRHHGQIYSASAAHETSAEINNIPTGANHTSRNQAVPCDKAQNSKHEMMARGIAKWDWDGTIPDHVVKGPFVKGGNAVDICTIVDASWYKVHYGGTCKYIPRSFLDIDGVYHPKFQSLFWVGGNVPQVVDIRYLYIPPEPPKQNLFVALCCGASPPPDLYNQGVRPLIPTLPSE